MGGERSSKRPLLAAYVMVVGILLAKLALMPGAWYSQLASVLIILLFTGLVWRELRRRDEFHPPS